MASERGWKFCRILDTSICACSIDSVNAGIKYGLQVAGGGGGRIGGLALQAIGFGGRLFVTANSLPLPDVRRLSTVAASRSAFLSALIPSANDVDLRVTRAVLLGLLHENSARLDGRDTQAPISLWHHQEHFSHA